MGEYWEQWGRMSRREQVFPPIRLHHLTVHGAGFATETAFWAARGLLTGCVSSCYHDGAHGVRRPNKFDVDVPASPFPSALVFFLFFHDASGPLHYPLTRTRQTWNVLVYSFCVILGVAPVTYKEHINKKQLRSEDNAHKCRAGARGDGGQMLKVLLSRCCRRLERYEES